MVQCRRRSDPRKVEFTAEMWDVQMVDHDRLVIGADRALFIYSLSAEKVLHEVRKDHCVFAPLAVTQHHQAADRLLIAVRVKGYVLHILDSELRVVQIMKRTNWIESVAFTADDTLLMYNTRLWPEVCHRLDPASSGDAPHEDY